MRKIYTVLVTYNPNPDELITIIDILKRQTDVVIICNNSDFNLYLENERVKVFNFNENLGIAKAQSIGMKWAFDNGADLILQMDQDSIPADNMVAELLECYDFLEEKGYKVGLVGPRDHDKDTGVINKARVKKGKSILGKEYLLVDQTLSSGSLIPKCIYSLIGGMDNELFIDAVDSEYCWRINKSGFIVVVNNHACLAHKLGDGNKSIFGFLSVGVPAPIRHYYQVRNTLILIRRGYAPLYWKFSMTLKVFFKLIFYPFVLDNGRERFKYIVKGLYDGVLGRVGKISS